MELTKENVIAGGVRARGFLGFYDASGDDLPDDPTPMSEEETTEETAPVDEPTPSVQSQPLGTDPVEMVTDCGPEETTPRRLPRLSLQDLQLLPPHTLVNRVPMLTRSDFGGQDKERVAVNRAAKEAPEFKELMERLPQPDAHTVSCALVKTAEHTALGCRKRIASTINEIRRRFGLEMRPVADDLFEEDYLA